MPPKFALQSVLDYHHSRVDVLEGDYGRLIQLKVKAEETLAGFESEQDRLFCELKEMQTGEMDLQGITLIRVNLKRVQSDIEKQLQIIQALARAIEAKHLELVQARQDEAVFEKLKEKELNRFNEKILIQEKILLDDIYISKAHRQPSRKEQE